MPDFCEKCRYFYKVDKKLKGFGNNIPKKGNIPSNDIPQNECGLGHRITKNKDGRIVPFTRGFICNDFTAK